MKRPVVPFSVPRKIDPNLVRVRAYWESLKRRQNPMPFWDDFKNTALPDLSDRLILIDVFEQPERFRFNFIGQQLIDRHGDEIVNKFIDELKLRNPLEYLPSQCSATVESGAPTYYLHHADEVQKLRGPVSYSRLLLPMWGNGHIGMLLGIVDLR